MAKDINKNADNLDNVQDQVEEQAKAMEAQVENAGKQAEDNVRNSNPEVSDEEAIAAREEAKAEAFDKQAKAMGFDAQDIKDIQNAIDNNLPLGPILGRIAVKSLNIWLVSEENFTRLVKYTQFDDLVPTINPENGNITFDYSTSTDIDGKHVYHASIKGSGEKLEDIWQQDKMEVGRESYQATFDYHKTVLTFEPLFTSTHKSVYFYMAQINDIQKRLGEPFARFEMALKGRIAWLGLDAMNGITGTEDAVTIADTVAPTPDVTITTTNMMQAVQMLNNLFKLIVDAPSDTLFDDIAAQITALGATADVTALKKMFAIKGMDKDIWRSVSNESLKMLAPVEWLQAYNSQRAGLFQLGLGSVAETVESKLVVKNYNLFEKFSHVTGLKHDITTVDKDKAKGSVDFLIWTPGVYMLIDQYKATETFAPGNFTRVINEVRKKGVAMRKYEGDFLLRVRLTVTPEEPKPDTKTE